MIRKTFQRYELKYLLDPEQFRQLRPLLEPYMEADPYGGSDGTYMIYNLYFDTEQDDIIRHSTAGPVFKEKLRLRSYRLPVSENDPVCLELKSKLNGVVGKRRANLRKADAERFLATGQIPEPLAYIDRQVLQEISAFLKRYPARPKVYVSYERLAMHGRDDPEFRITFDRNILTRRDHPDFASGDYGTELLENDEVLMEIKILGALPLWLAHALSALGIYSTGFSKYGTEYRKHVAERRRHIGFAPAPAAVPQNQETLPGGAAARVPVPETTTAACLKARQALQTGGKRICWTRSWQLPNRRP